VDTPYFPDDSDFWQVWDHEYHGHNVKPSGGKSAKPGHGGRPSGAKSPAKPTKEGYQTGEDPAKPTDGGYETGAQPPADEYGTGEYPTEGNVGETKQEKRWSNWLNIW
jgi:hypothetical protein